MNDRCDCCRKNLRGQQKYLSPINPQEELCAKCLDDILAELGTDVNCKDKELNRMNLEESILNEDK